MILLIVRNMQTYYIGIFQQIVKADVFEPEPFCQFWILELVECNDFHIKALCNSRHMLPYASSSHNANGFALQVRSSQAVEGEITPYSPVISLVYFPCQVKDKGKSMLCNSVFSIVGNIADCYFSLFALLQVNVVKAC